jgi:hypothetical protein
LSNLLPRLFPNIHLGPNTIMPNHFHGIVVINHPLAPPVRATQIPAPAASSTASPRPIDPLGDHAGSPLPESSESHAGSPLPESSKSHAGSPLPESSESPAGSPLPPITSSYGGGPGENRGGFQALHALSLVVQPPFRSVCIGVLLWAPIPPVVFFVPFLAQVF